MENEFFVSKVQDIPEGKARVCEAGGAMIAVFNDGGVFKAIDDMCPHAGASLAEGWLDDGCVTCPWHAWQFRLTDGAYLNNPRLHANVYDTKVVGDDVFVILPARKRDAT